MATKRLYRARKGELLGVCRGIAEWRDLPVDAVRLIFILVAIFTAVFPCLVIYIALGLILPVNPYDDDENRAYAGSRRERREGRKYYYHPEPEDFVNEEPKANAKANAEDYERMKKESDWDNRFSNS